MPNRQSPEENTTATRVCPYTGTGLARNPLQCKAPPDRPCTGHVCRQAAPARPPLATAVWARPLSGPEPRTVHFSHAQVLRLAGCSWRTWVARQSADACRRAESQPPLQSPALHHSQSGAAAQLRMKHVRGRGAACQRWPRNGSCMTCMAAACSRARLATCLPIRAHTHQGAAMHACINACARASPAGMHPSWVSRCNACPPAPMPPPPPRQRIRIRSPTPPAGQALRPLPETTPC